MKQKITQVRYIFQKLKTGTHIEYHETKLMITLISKKDKTEEEKKFIKEQLADLGRIGVGGAITALPFGSILFLFIAKILKESGDIDLLPSGFEQDAKLHKLAGDLKQNVDKN